MRRLTRNVLLGLLAVVLVLLALGALPGLLRAGDPYYLTATPTGQADSPAVAADGGAAGGADGAPDRPTATIDAANLSADRFRYTTAALDDATAEQAGRSPPYWRGPVGLKGAFTHSPFDELASLAGRESNATDGDAVFVRREETTFRLAVEQETDT